MAKPSKQFKKFAASGKLKETIQKRRSIQQSKRKFDEKTAQRAKQRGKPADEGVSDEEDEDEEGANARDMKKANTGGRAGGVARTVDELFGADGGLAGPPDAPDDEGEGDEDDLSEGSGDEDESSEMGDELERDEEAMKKAMKDLEKKDPEFFKYLAENDKTLLDFGDGGAGEDDDEDEDMEAGDDEDEEMDEDDEVEDDGDDDVIKKVVVTGKMLRQWQEGMLRQHSLKSLRSTLLAFRSAAHMNEEETQGAGGTKYAINSPAVFNKLVVTALKFTPVVLAHHIPYKTQRDGRIKVSQPKKPNARLTRLILSHFTTLLHFIRTLPSRPLPGTEDDEDAVAGGLLLVALSESSKLVPWVLSARKHVRAYLKVLLELWSSASDNVRIAAFLAVRKLFVGGDDSIRDICLKNTYRALLAPLRHTTPHSLPTLNLLKNTASELFLLNQPISYPHAFTAIRMLAVHLRDCIRDVTAAPSTRNAPTDGPPKKDVGQEAFRKVYNWQFVHTLDFWCRTLGAGCSKEAELERGGIKSELEMLIYPLVQIALGVIRLLPSPRYFPLRFHILHSLLSLSSKTGIYIPLTPYLLEILDSADFRSSGKKSTLKPLDLEYVIRAPQAYPRTRIYQEVIGEELVYLLAGFHALYSTNIAFPEIALPAILTIKKHLKKGTAGAGKTANQFKVLVEKLEEGRKFVETRRRGVGFAPRDRSEIGKWEEGLGGVAKTPIGIWRGTLGKARERKRGEVERALREEK